MILECERYAGQVVYRNVPVENARYICIRRQKRQAVVSVVPSDPDGPNGYYMPHAVADRLVQYLEWRQTEALHYITGWPPPDMAPLATEE
jgi:hypothetical protein